MQGTETATMEPTTTNEFGSGNLSITIEGDEIVMRAKIGTILGKKGEWKKPDKADDKLAKSPEAATEYRANEKNKRQRDLIATSNGFARCQSFEVSVNITR